MGAVNFHVAALADWDTAYDAVVHFLGMPGGVLSSVGAASAYSVDNGLVVDSVSATLDDGAAATINFTHGMKGSTLYTVTVSTTDGGKPTAAGATLAAPNVATFTSGPSFKVASAAAYDDTHIDLTMSESDVNFEGEVAAYTIDSGLSVVAVALINGSTIRLTLDAPMLDGSTYLVSTSNLFSLDYPQADSGHFFEEGSVSFIAALAPPVTVVSAKYIDPVHVDVTFDSPLSTVGNPAAYVLSGRVASKVVATSNPLVARVTTFPMKLATTYELVVTTTGADAPKP